MIFRNWVLQNFPFLEDDFDALTDYELFCKMVEYMKKSLEKIKDYQEELDSFNVKLNEFQHYFDNLDLQEEVNNKLDEMAESGELADVIAQYLGLAGVLAYDTIADLQEAENIVNGSICRTLGANTYNDGKGAFYKIRELTISDVIDNYNIVALDVSDSLIAERIFNKEVLELEEHTLFIYDTIEDLQESTTNIVEGYYVKTNGYYAAGDGGEGIYKIVSSTGHTADEIIYITLSDENLFAELIDKNKINFEMFGAKGDGTTDDTLALQTAISYLEDNSINYLKSNSKIYLVTDTIEVTKDINIDFNNSIIKTNTSLSTLFKISNTERGGSIINCTFDGSNVLSKVVLMEQGANYTFSHNYIINVGANAYGLYITTVNRNFEFKVLNTTIIGGDNIITNTGIYVDANDCIFDNIIIERCNTGIFANKGIGILSNCHIWVYTGQYDTSAGIIFNNYSEENLITNLIIDGCYKDIICNSDCPVISINGIHSYIDGSITYPSSHKYFLYLNSYNVNLPISINGGMIKGSTNGKMLLCNHSVNLRTTNVAFSYCVNPNTTIADNVTESAQNSLVSNITYNRYTKRFNNFTSKAYEFTISTSLTVGTTYTLVNETNLRLVPICPRDYITTTNSGKRVLVKFDRDGGNFSIKPLDAISSGDSLNVTVNFADSIVVFNNIWE